MKDVFIKYNPYAVETEVIIDGERVKANSSLNFPNGTHLQEKVDDIPQMLREECQDANLKITFRGTKADFEDLQTAFDANKDIAAELTLEEIRSIDDAEKIIDEVFNEIQYSPYNELNTPEIIQAFEDAKSQKFYVNVVATMSSGKSTLINALLGKDLMPTASEPTTAVIVEIENDDNAIEFSAKVYGEDKINVIADRRPIELEDMNEFNNKTDVSTIHLLGKIPFITNSNIRLVLVDTPGPNSCHNINDYVKTYDMLKNSENSIVLYVMNATQIGINDDNLFLSDVCQEMTRKGKFSKDRFIFVVNKCDDLKLKNNSTVEDFIKINVCDYLKEHKIDNANIFPVSAGAARELRCGITPDESEECLVNFDRKIKRDPDQFNFNSYTQFSHLPKSAQNDIDEMLRNADDNKKLEIYSGITAIEKAIALYINKYARAMKINDLLKSFQQNVRASELTARIENEILSHKEAIQQAADEIPKLKKQYEDAQEAKKKSEEIDNEDFVKPIREKLTNLTKPINVELTKIILKYADSNKVPPYEAKGIIAELQLKIRNIFAKLQSDCKAIFVDTMIAKYNASLTEYKKAIADLSLGSKIGNIDLDLSKLADAAPTAKIAISSDYVLTIDEGHRQTIKKRVPVKASFLRRLFSWLPFVDKEAYETTEENKWIPDKKDYVDLRSLVRDSIAPLQTNLRNATNEIISQANMQASNLKETLKQEIKRIDDYIKLQISEWQNFYDKSKKAEDAKKRCDEKLQWIKHIQERINSITDRV